METMHGEVGGRWQCPRRTCLCVGELDSRNSSSIHLSCAPCLKNTTEANTVLPGRKVVMFSGPLCSAG